MNKVLRAVSVFLVLIVSAGLISWQFYFKRMWAIGRMSIERVDATGVADGIHTGAFQTPYKTYQVHVAVSNRTITRIDIEPGDRFWSYFDNEARAVGERVIRSQRTDVDVVSGATVTSKAILKAVENALTGGRRVI